MLNLVFDFDSTLVRDEGLDLLFERSLARLPDRAERVERFREITDRGMAGQISYADSLAARLALLEADRPLVQATGRALADRISPSLVSRADFFRGGLHRILVVSGGFVELIEPVADRLGIPRHEIHAQRFRFDAQGRIAGIDPDTPLARGGKVEAVRRLALDPERTWVVGDGATDLELRDEGLARTFVAYTENRHRPPVVDAADHVATRLDDLLGLIERHTPNPATHTDTSS